MGDEATVTSTVKLCNTWVSVTHCHPCHSRSGWSCHTDSFLSPSGQSRDIFTECPVPPGSASQSPPSDLSTFDPSTRASAAWTSPGAAGQLCHLEMQRGTPLTARSCPHARCVSLDTREFAQASALFRRREPPRQLATGRGPRHRLLQSPPDPGSRSWPRRPRRRCAGQLLLTGTQAEHQDEADIHGGGRQDYGKSHPPQAHSGQTGRIPSILRGSVG